MIFLSTTLAGVTERLARVAASDAIHDSTPRAAVEGSQIRPHRRLIKGLLFHARCQDFDGVGFPLNVTDAASRSAKCEFKPEFEASDA